MEKISDVVFVLKTIGSWNKKEIAITVGIDRIKQYSGKIKMDNNNQFDLSADNILPHDLFAENYTPDLTAQDKWNKNSMMHPYQEQTNDHQTSFNELPSVGST